MHHGAGMIIVRSRTPYPRPAQGDMSSIRGLRLVADRGTSESLSRCRCDRPPELKQGRADLGGLPNLRQVLEPL